MKVEVISGEKDTTMQMRSLKQGVLAEVIDGCYVGAIVVGGASRFTIIYRANRDNQVPDAFDLDCTLNVRVLRPDEKLILSNS